MSIVIVTVLFISCEETATTASLRLRLTDRVSSMRTLYSPLGEGLEIYGYIIEGTGPSDQTLSITSHSPQVEISGLMIGTWKLKVTGVNQQGTPLATGEATFQLTTKANSVEIPVDTLYGVGSMEIGLSWGSEVFEDIEVEMSVRDQKEIVTDVSKSVTVDENACTASFSDSYPAGIYEIHYNVLSNNVLIAGGIDIIRVLDQKKTVAEVILDVHKITQEATGLTITNPLGAKIEGKIGGVEEVVAPNKEMTATYTTSEPAHSPYDVTWYLDGSIMGTGSSITFSTYTGPHRLDAVARGSEVLTVGADTHSFQVSVGETDGVPALVSSYSDPSSDEEGRSLYLNSIQKARFLLDGRLLLAGNNGLQVCDVKNDALSVVNSYTSTGGSYKSDPYPTQGITSIAYDSDDNLVFTVNSSTGVFTVYRYDSEDGSLVKSDAVGSDGQNWGESLSNIVIDPVTNNLYFVDRVTSKVHAFTYEGGKFTLQLSIKLAGLFQTVKDGKSITISEAFNTLVVACPSNNTFHTYRIVYDGENRPTVLLRSNDLLDKTYGTIEKGFIINEKLQLLTDKGWHLFTYNNGRYSHTYEQQIGLSTAAMKEAVFNSTCSMGWMIEDGEEMKITPFDIIQGVPIVNETSAVLPKLSGVSATLAPKGNYMAVTGSSSLRLYRLNDL